jgi:hypothetical protein
MAATAQLQPQSPPLYAWFQLVENSGNAFRNSRPSRVLLAAGAIVDDFCKAVKAEYADSHLKGIAASNLVVYENKAALAANEPPLEPFVPLDGMGADHASALVVVVPQTFAVQQPAPSELPHRGTYFLSF